MMNIEAYSTDQYYVKYLQRLFKRYDKNKLDYLTEEDFKNLLRNLFDSELMSFSIDALY
jgi:hypothetical protein